MTEAAQPESPGLSDKLAIIIPSYNNEVSIPTMAAIINAAAWLLRHPKRNVEFMWPQNSLLARCFNMGWSQALNYRPDLTRIVMVHSDIAPVPENWIDLLLDIMDEEKCHVMSVVAPIKVGDGRSTSTGWEDPSGDGLNYKDRWQMHLDTKAGEDGVVRDGLESMPETITNDWLMANYGRRLLINTGCMAVKFDEPWVEEFAFNIQDCLERDEGGTWGARVNPEDWNMSQWLARRGIPYGCTREIPVAHSGSHIWRVG